MRIKEIAKEWREYSRTINHIHRRPSSMLKAVLTHKSVRSGMCRAIRKTCSYTGLLFFQHTGLFTQTAYLRYHWTCLEVWRRWWHNAPYWDDDSDEAAERRIAFIKHLIKKLEKHGL